MIPSKVHAGSPLKACTTMVRSRKIETAKFNLGFSKSKGSTVLGNSQTPLKWGQFLLRYLEETETGLFAISRTMFPQVTDDLVSFVVGSQFGLLHLD